MRLSILIYIHPIINPQKNLLMRNNILGGLVIFMVVVTCLLMLDDMSNPKEKSTIEDTAQVEQTENQTDLVIVENKE